MPMLDVKTSWPVEELFDQAIASVSDDTRWLVQTQSDRSLVIRREKGVPLWKWLIIGIAALVTFGLGLILLPIIVPDTRNQQIVINAKPGDGYTSVRITFTSGAKRRVNTLTASIPRPYGEDREQAERIDIQDNLRVEDTPSSDQLRRSRPSGGNRSSREYQTHYDYEREDASAAIRCNKCGTENTSTAQFCASCGTRFYSQANLSCPRCGSKISPDARFCISCGSSLEQARSNGVCSKCNTRNKAGAKFCTNCGNLL